MNVDSAERRRVLPTPLSPADMSAGHAKFPSVNEFVLDEQHIVELLDCFNSPFPPRFPQFGVHSSTPPSLPWYISNWRKKRGIEVVHDSLGASGDD